MSAYDYQSLNTRKTLLLMSVFFVLIIFLGWFLSYYFSNAWILYGAVAFSIVMNFLSYFYSDKVALALAGARPVAKEDAPELYRIVENLSITAGLPMPRVYLTGDPQINAFATGRNPQHAALAVTQGALQKLAKPELEGVIAHELSHVKNNDILIGTIAVVLAGIISVITDLVLRMTFWGWGNRRRDEEGSGSAVVFAVGFIAMVLAPVAATLIRLAVSRSRESLADASGVLLTRYPDGLIGALRKIENDTAPLPHASLATSHLYLADPYKDDSPLRGKTSKTPWFVKLFMTHPPLEERIQALEALRMK